MLILLQPTVIVAQGRRVWNFIRSRQLPPGATAVEGVHHADRRSSEVKDKLLSAVRVALRRRT